MHNLDFDIKKDNAYKFGVNLGFLIAFLLFVSIFYFIMALLDKIPQNVKYYHIAAGVFFVYFMGLIYKKIKK